MKHFKKFVSAVLLLTASKLSIGSLDDQMRKSFNGLVNTTPAGHYQGQTRGVITGGNIYVRNKIANVNLVDFQAPRIKAGCGGIDIFKGAFSFISKAEFTALLQAIASNAVGYAFQLAMDIICPTCAQNMKELQDRVQKLNGVMANSCEIAKAGINKFTPLQQLADESVREHGRQASAMWAQVDSWFDGLPWSRTGGNPTDTRKNNIGATGEKGQFKGNVVWKALLHNDVAAWYTYGANSNEFYEILMDLAGTITIKVTEDPKAGVGGTPEKIANTTDANNLKTVINTHHGNLTMKNFLLGATAADNVTKMTCTDGHGFEQCLTIAYNPVVFEGMERKVEKMLMGDGASLGIIAKLRDKGAGSGTTTEGHPTTFTAAEALFVTAASPGIIGLMRDFAHDLRTARAVADVFKYTIAQEMTIAFVTEMIDSVQRAVETGPGLDGNYKEKVYEVLDKSSQKIRAAREHTSTTLQGVSQAFAVASYMRTSLKSRIDIEREPISVQ